MKALISGLVNFETNVKVRQFPINYYPIDYPFFGVSQSVGGVGYNISKALRTLGDEVDLYTYTGKDLTSEMIFNELEKIDVSGKNILTTLKETPASVVLYDETGKRQIYCDLKDIQEQSLDSCKDLGESDICILCNINFNRRLLKAAKDAGKIIATDVHVLSDIEDDYNRDFMENADILFLSDENLPCEFDEFILKLAKRYGSKIIVMGRGSKGCAYYEANAGETETGKVRTMPAVELGKVLNTVGAGDALFSAFIHFYMKGQSVEEVLMRAQIFAAKKIQSNGAAVGFVSEDDVEQIYINSKN